MGITWGVWTSVRAQAIALKVCGVFGALLAVISMGALWGMWSAGRPEIVDQAIQIEDRMYEGRVAAGEVVPNEEKRARPMKSGDAPTDK
jgi:hypothetical protein